MIHLPLNSRSVDLITREQTAKVDLVQFEENDRHLSQEKNKAKNNQVLEKKNFQPVSCKLSGWL